MISCIAVEFNLHNVASNQTQSASCALSVVSVANHACFMHFVVLTLFPNMSTGSLMGTSSTTVISFSLTFICTQLTICHFASIVLHMFFCMLHFCKVLFVPAFLITSALEIELLLNSCLIFGFDSPLLRHRFLLVNPASFIQHQKSISRSFLYSSLYFWVKQSKTPT